MDGLNVKQEGIGVTCMAQSTVMYVVRTLSSVGVWM